MADDSGRGDPVVEDYEGFGLTVTDFKHMKKRYPERRIIPMDIKEPRDHRHAIQAVVPSGGPTIAGPSTCRNGQCL
jgi:hypothetical protein